MLFRTSPTSKDLMESLHARLRQLAPRRQRLDGERVQPGDDVVCDVIGVSGGKVIPGSFCHELLLEMQPLPHLQGLTEAMLGMVTGETRVVELTLATDESDCPLATVRATFTIECREVYAVEMPRLDDPRALAAAGLGNDIVTALRTIARESMGVTHIEPRFVCHAKVAV